MSTGRISKQEFTLDVVNEIESALKIGTGDGSFDKTVTAPTSSSRLNYNGYLYATKVYGAVYNDYAEYFEKGENGLEPGDIISLDPNSKEEKYVKANELFPNLVVGVLSDEYSHCIGGQGDGNDEKNYIPIGLAGRVKVKTIGNVSKGDFITISSQDGIGRSTKDYIPGTIIGKALEDKKTNSVERIRVLICNM